jgi:hypothetical protein
MLCASAEVRTAFRKKYGKGESIIGGNAADGRLALIATTSALGRSSIYNRLRFGGRRLMQSVGFTSGWGEFQFTNGAYTRLHAYAMKYSKPTAKQKSWGTGFRNRREVVRKCLANLGLSDQLLNHGIKRELFVMPLASNTREFLQGHHARLQWYHQSVKEIVEAFRERWLLPRAERDPSYADYDREAYRLWRPSR